MQKKALRTLYLDQRKQLATTQVATDSTAICTQFIQLLAQAPALPAYLHVFLPILKNNEIDTWQIIRHVWQHLPQVNIVTSVTNFKTKAMDNYLLTPDTTLVTSSWGIPEPQGATPVKDHLIDWVIVPLLCFDNRGYRVGYGGGFYDRFLQKCVPETKKMGVSLTPPVQSNIEDINAFDVPLDYCITSDKIYRFDHVF